MGRGSDRRSCLAGKWLVGRHTRQPHLVLRRRRRPRRFRPNISAALHRLYDTASAGRLRSRAKAPTTGKLANGWHRSTSWSPRLSRLSSSRSASSAGCAIGPNSPTLVPMVSAAGSGLPSCFRRDDRGGEKAPPKNHTSTFRMDFKSSGPLQDRSSPARRLCVAAWVSQWRVVFFCIFVAAPAIGSMAPYAVQRDVKQFYDRLHLIFWISLILAGISGLAWFFCVVSEISDRPLSEIFSDDIAWTVLSATDFGRIWIARLFIGALLAATVWFQSREVKPNWCSLFQALLAAAFGAKSGGCGTPPLLWHPRRYSLNLPIFCTLLPLVRGSEDCCPTYCWKTFRGEPAAIVATQRF